jgi:hypothetical protein
MSVLPLNRVQCDRCRTVHTLAATSADQFGTELWAAGWRARLIRGTYRHACHLCAADLLAEFEGRRPK